MFSEIKGILFDLDDTLWDFHANAQEALMNIWQIIKSKGQLPTSKQKEFFSSYHKHNNQLWTEYRQNKRDAASIRAELFKCTAADMGLRLEDSYSLKLADDFLSCLYDGELMIPYAKEILMYLKNDYQLGLVTNGFKRGLYRLEACGIASFFDVIICSEEYGYPKPHPGIFQHAVACLGGKTSEYVYIGDNYLGDIVGAKNAGLKTVYFNKVDREQPIHVIQSDAVITDLLELKKLFF